MSNVTVHTSTCACGRTVLTAAPEDDPMVLLSVERAQLAALSTVEDDDAPSITDIPWRF